MQFSRFPRSTSDDTTTLGLAPVCFGLGSVLLLLLLEFLLLLLSLLLLLLSLLWLWLWLLLDWLERDDASVAGDLLLPTPYSSLAPKALAETTSEAAMGTAVGGLKVEVDGADAIDLMLLDVKSLEKDEG